MHSIPHLSHESLYLSSKVTTAGDDSFSPKLKLWVFAVKGSQSLYLAPYDPQITSEILKVTRDDKHKGGKVFGPCTKPSIDISWFDRAMQPTSVPLKPVDIIPVIAGLTDMLKKCYFDEVDLLLKSFKVNDAAPEMMVALLRTTFPLRGKPLRHWSKLLRQVRAELTSRQLDSEKILRGLA